MNVKNLINEVLTNKFIDPKKLMESLDCKSITGDNFYYKDCGEFTVYLIYAGFEYPSRIKVKQKYKSWKSNRTVTDLVLDFHFSRKDIGKNKAKFGYFYIDRRSNHIADSMVHLFKSLNYSVKEESL